MTLKVSNKQRPAYAFCSFESSDNELTDKEKQEILKQLPEGAEICEVQKPHHVLTGSGLSAKHIAETASQRIDSVLTGLKKESNKKKQVKDNPFAMTFVREIKEIWVYENIQIAVCNDHSYWYLDEENDEWQQMGMKMLPKIPQPTGVSI